MNKPLVHAARALALLWVTQVSTLALAAEADTQQMHQDYMAAMSGMQDSMHAGMTENDPDAAFAKGMVPHHTGAVEMAKIELKYGKDPQMRALAEKVIQTQSQEIAEMNAWIAAHPK